MQSIDFMKKYKECPGLGTEFTPNDRVATYFPAQPAGNK